MNMKKIFLRILTVALVLTGLAALALTVPWKGLTADPGAPSVRFRGNGKSFEVLQDGAWQPFRPTGVNMGNGYPGEFPGESSISEETYLRWFRLISEMNANTVRVYQLQVPAFYNALVRHNETSSRPLYLIQSIEFPDQLMYSELDLLDDANTRQLFRDSRRIVDALHGDAVLHSDSRDSLEIYVSDVSPYLVGYMLGVEWDELFVEYVDRTHPDTPPYQGTAFACSADASPFESFLARWGDDLLCYETERYGSQPMISFANWAETDPLINEIQLRDPNPGFRRQNVENRIDPEHILPTELNHSGLFASYNIYPYYPLFLQYGPYTAYTDSDGAHNPYQGYLRQLVRHHSCPVLISEYGVPACRSTAYRDCWRDFSHGGANEVQQGQAVASLYRDINEAGCAGSLVFTWQDEWFKRAWNEMYISDPDRRPAWSNAQCVEQSFGLLAFEPGTPETIIYPDGDLSDWTDADTVYTSGRTALRMRSDERYLYFLVEGLDPDGQNAVNLALDVTPRSGVTEIGDRTFDRPVDFLIHISRDGTGSIEVNAAYDLLIYSMGDKLRASLSGSAVRDYNREYMPDFEDSGYDRTFHPIYRARGSIRATMCRHYEMEPAGLLRHGNANPGAADFDSNADFFLDGDRVELRIPWQLLNFRDPSSCTVVDDLRENDGAIQSLKIDAVYACVYFDGDTDPADFAVYPLHSWLEPTWHERLKASYYILRDTFKGGR